MMKRIALILVLSLLPGVALAGEKGGERDKNTFKQRIVAVKPSKKVKAVELSKEVKGVELSNEVKEVEVPREVKAVDLPMEVPTIEPPPNDVRATVHKDRRVLQKRLLRVLNNIRHKLYALLGRGHFNDVREFVGKLEALANEIPPVNKPPTPKLQPTPQPQPQPQPPTPPPVIDPNDPRGVLTIQ